MEGRFIIYLWSYRICCVVSLVLLCFQVPALLQNIRNLSGKPVPNDKHMAYYSHVNQSLHRRGLPVTRQIRTVHINYTSCHYDGMYKRLHSRLADLKKRLILNAVKKRDFFFRIFLFKAYRFRKAMNLQGPKKDILKEKSIFFTA